MTYNVKNNAPIPTNSQRGDILPWGITKMLPTKKSALAENHPYVDVSRRPEIMKNMASAESMAPITSKPGLGPSFLGSTILRLRKIISKTTKVDVMKAARQLIVVVIIPPIRGPDAAPIPPAALITPKALARAMPE
jgi:hypothetical protein